jgi:hypothetical protein
VQELARTGNSILLPLSSLIGLTPQHAYSFGGVRICCDQIHNKGRSLLIRENNVPFKYEQVPPTVFREAFKTHDNGY